MNDALLGTLAVLLSIATYLIGYATGRYCHRSKCDVTSNTINTYRIEQKRAEVDAFINNVRVMGKDVDPDTLLVIDPKTKDNTAGTKP